MPRLPRNRARASHPRPHPGDRGRFEPINQGLWAFQSSGDLAEKLFGFAEGVLPHFSHTISVAARGGPESDLRRIWYLCCAAAFGRYRNRAFGVQGAVFEATWDVTGKACSVTIGYRNNGLLGAASTDASASGLGLLQRGPDQVTLGASWPRFLWTDNQIVAAPTAVIGGGIRVAGVIGPAPLPTVDFNRYITTASPFAAWSVVLATCSPGAGWPLAPFGGTGKNYINILREIPRAGVAFWRRVMPTGIGGSAALTGSIRVAGVGVPMLPDDGRIITTGEKRDPRVQNPKPQLDGLSRNSLVSLVSQALQNPCILPTQVPCSSVIPQPLGSPGVYLYPPGFGVDSRPDDNVALQPLDTFSAARFNSAGSSIPNLAIGPDGYPTPPSTAPNLRTPSNPP